jgi:hypothetical protein
MVENRFKKSVDIATSNTLDNIKDNALTNIIDNALTNITDNTTVNIKNNILDNILEKEKKSKGSNYTFYLSAEVGEALAKLSKKTKQSKSTLVNDILKAVLQKNISS